jgi:hypothetical protein
LIAENGDLKFVNQFPVFEFKVSSSCGLSTKAGCDFVSVISPDWKVETEKTGSALISFCGGFNSGVPEIAPL